MKPSGSWTVAELRGLFLRRGNRNRQQSRQRPKATAAAETHTHTNTLHDTGLYRQKPFNGCLATDTVDFRVKVKRLRCLINSNTISDTIYDQHFLRSGHSLYGKLKGDEEGVRQHDNDMSCSS